VTSLPDTVPAAVAVPASRRGWVDAEHGHWLPVRWLARGVNVLLVVTLAVLFAVVIGNVITRNLFGFSLVWESEITSLGIAVLSFLGGAVAYRERKHIALQVLKRVTPDHWHERLDTFSDAVVCAVGVLLAVISWPLLSQQAGTRTPVLDISQTWFDAVFTVGMVLLAVFALERILVRGRRDVAFGLGIFVAVALVEVVLVLTAAAFTASGLVAFTIASVVVLLLCGVPIAFVLAASGELYLFYTANAPPSTGVINMSQNATHFVLVAIPFFILAGALMTHAGLSTRLAEFTHALLRRVPGSLQHVVVVTMYLFSGLSGSKIADVAAVGSALQGPMRKAGYPPGETAALLSASAVMGESVPPSTIMLVLASITSLSVAGLFAAGIVPAALIGVLLMALILVRARLARRRGETVGETPRLAHPWRTAVRAVPALVVPLILIIGIITGIASPTEISALAVAAAIVIGAVLRKLSGRALWTSSVETSVTVGMVLLIVSGASNFAWTVSVSGIANDVQHLAASIGNRYLFILVTFIVLPIFGTLLEGLPAVLMLGPILLPAATALGIPAFQYAVLFVITMGLGTFAPPIGVGLYAACSTCAAAVGDTARRLAPYWLAILAGLVVIALVPALSLALPHLAGY
jgi:tripartite ATP-independent transporter DctM subunit